MLDSGDKSEPNALLPKPVCSNSTGNTCSPLLCTAARLIRGPLTDPTQLTHKQGPQSNPILLFTYFLVRVLPTAQQKFVNGCRFAWPPWQSKVLVWLGALLWVCRFLLIAGETMGFWGQTKDKYKWSRPRPPILPSLERAGKILGPKHILQSREKS